MAFVRCSFALALAACAREPAKNVTLAPPTPSAQVVSAPSHVSLLPPKAIAWQWDGDEPGFGTSFYHAPRTVTEGSLTCTFTYQEPRATIACAENGRELWHEDEGHAFVADASLAIDHGTLYAARFSDIATGCTLRAFDARSGVVKWSYALAGIGPTAHSEYLNVVHLRIIQGQPVVFGWESNGRYIEAVDPMTGKDTFHVVLPSR